MQMMAAKHDNLTRSHEVLKGQSDALFRQRAEEIKASEDKLSRLMFTQKFDLLDMKAMQPEMLKGPQAQGLLQHQAPGVPQGTRMALARDLDAISQR